MREMDVVWEHGENLFFGFKCKYCVKKFHDGGATRYHELFTCIVYDFMVLSCVLCMTPMLFIYVYYVLFIYTNLVDVMLLFLTVFSFNLPIFDKKNG
jgi:hypothetical protein